MSRNWNTDGCIMPGIDDIQRKKLREDIQSQLFGGIERGSGDVGLKKYQPNKKDWEQTMLYNRSLEAFPEQEAMMNMVFQSVPENTPEYRSWVKMKVALVNLLYNANVKTIYYDALVENIINPTVAQQIINGNVDAVSEIANVSANGKVSYLYSFATKYCSFSNPLHYPIYDRRVAYILQHYMKGNLSANSYYRKIRDYQAYKEQIDLFRQKYGLESCSYKEVDRYLWLLSKHLFK